MADAKCVNPAPAVEHISSGAVREDYELTSYIETGPVGSPLRPWWRRVPSDPKWVNSSVAVQNVAARAVGKELQITCDVPPEVIASVHLEAGTIRM